METIPQKATKKPFSLESIKVDTLAEIQGKKEALQAVITSNPYVEITDTATYEQAKKHRTALRTARTETEKEEKAVFAKVKEILTEPLKGIYGEFKDTIRPAEDKQQAEVTRFEDTKEQERQERLRQEEERKQKHRDTIENWYNTTKSMIDNLNFEAAKEYVIEAVYQGLPIPDGFFEEFHVDFETKVDFLKYHLEDKKRQLQREEDLRVERENLDREQAERNRIDGIKNTIEAWYNQWENNIERFMEFEDIEKVTRQFSDEKVLDCAEFQPLYAEKRAALVKKLENRTATLTTQEDLRKKQEDIDRQQNQVRLDQQALLIDKRKSQLTAMGFDKDGAYDNNGLKLIISEDDLLADSDDWHKFIQDATDKITAAAQPSPDEIQVTDATVLTDEKQPEAEIVKPEQFMTAAQINAQQVLYDFEEYLSINNIEFGPGSINLFVKSLA